MEIDDFINQIIKIEEKEREQKIWEFWLVKYPLMTKDTFETYEEMLEESKNQRTETKNNEAQQGYYIDQVGLF